MSKKLFVNSQTYNPMFMVSEEGVSEYQILTQGIYVGKIAKVRYDPVRALFIVVFTLADGDTHSEFYHMTKKNGEMANYGIRALANLLKAAYQIDAIDRFDVDAVKGSVGRYVIFEIVHEDYNNRLYDRIDPFSYAPADDYGAVVYVEDDVAEESDEAETSAEA